MAIINRNIFKCISCNYESAFELEIKNPTCPYCNCKEMKQTYSNGAFEEEDLKKLLEDSNKYANCKVVHIGTVKPVVSCPYCQSTNCSKIGVISRSLSFGLFGFASGKVGKQWHCNNCSSDF